MPFGLKTTPANFIRLMDKVIDGLENVISCFDDIIIFTDTWEDHLTTLKSVLSRLSESKLKIRPSKCTVGMNEIECLGHVVGSVQVKPDNSKMKAMVDFLLSTIKKQIR